MTFLQIASVLFIFSVIFISIITTRLFHLKRWGMSYIDIAFPLFSIGFYFVSDQAFYHSGLPQLTMALSLLAILITIYFLKTKKRFYYLKFLKFFWRLGAFLMFFMYLILTISIVLLKK